jgi:uncharacterized protein YbjT (DUF2867 family)
MANEVFGVTGAAGEIGGRVARRLADLGARQRLIVRVGARTPRLARAETREITDYGDKASFGSAAEELSTLFFVSGREHPERLRQHKTAMDAAVEAGIERIVYLSFVGAAPGATFTLARQHYATEQHIRAKDVAFTFLRSSPISPSSPGSRPPKVSSRAPQGRAGWRRSRATTSPRRSWPF